MGDDNTVGERWPRIRQILYSQEEEARDSEERYVPTLKKNLEDGLVFTFRQVNHDEDGHFENKFSMTRVLDTPYFLCLMANDPAEAVKRYSERKRCLERMEENEGSDYDFSQPCAPIHRRRRTA